MPHQVHGAKRAQLKLLLTLITGIIVGFTLAQLLQNSKCTLEINDAAAATYHSGSEYSSRKAHSSWTGPEVKNPANISIAADKHSGLTTFETSQAKASSGNASLSDRLYQETRILCWVLTGPSNHEKRARHVKNTWGARCNKLIFMSSKEDADLGAIQLPGVREGHGRLWEKTREALKYIYEHHLNEADWFYKADDDTYLIPENLRAFLYQFSTDAPVYFGCKFKPHVRQGFMSGGAGYALSKEALRRFVEVAYPNPRICRQHSSGAEDIEMGRCLQNVGVVAGDSRDEQQRGRFFPMAPQRHLVGKSKMHWYWRYIYYLTEDGPNCCSDYAISFHYIQPDFFYVMDYFIYHLRPFGMQGRLKEELPSKLNMTALLDKWRNDTSDNPA